ncbi:MAG: hypothetical protein PQJ58_15935, partial [Spirochaetales bacterium]|nr:hypothetical protein [Spirochaetales bacterium]
VPECFTIDVPKEEDSLLLLYPPSLKNGCRMKPLGVFIPSYEDRGALSVEDGAAVSILMTLVQSGQDFSDFNCQRFLFEMGELDDPWLAEEETLLRQLSLRQMRSWYIREKTLFDLEIYLPSGSWYGSVPSGTPRESSGLENPVAIVLPEGYSFLVSPDRLELVEIQVDDHGQAVWIRESLVQEAPSQ